MSDSTSFVRLFVGFLLSATGAHASCPVELSPPSVVVKHGASVSVNCSTSESLFYNIGWEASQGGIEERTKKPNHLVWTVEHLTEWTSTPMCYINPSQDSLFKQCRQKLKLVLYTFPDTISINSSGGPDGVMNELEMYNFTCGINNIAPVQNLTVKWYKGDAVVYTDTSDDPSKVPVDRSSVFSFTPSREDDGVTIRCEAHLDLWPDGPQLNASSQEFNVSVHFGPELECFSSGEEVHLLEGETLERICNVTGNPVSTVTWLKDGRPTDPAAPLSRENEGRYSITAEGKVFPVQKIFRVRVMYGPELMCPSNYTAVEGAPNNLTCTVEGFPKPVTTWFKDGDEVELPENLTRSDTGQYLITASSPLSSVDLTVDINVMYPPSEIVELEDAEVDVGSTVWLKCSSTGNPRPKYFWDYYRTANVMEINEDGVSRLHIHNATGYNMGSYTCHAGNERGNVSTTARVTVKGDKGECPIEITPGRMVVRYQGSDQHATCKPSSADSVHVKEIYWQVLEGVITNSSSWSADTNKDWDPRPVCTASFNVKGTCQKHLDFTLYKTPDSVSIRLANNLSAVVEDREFQLQCDITNVAPAGNLVVQWYLGNETLSKGSLRVSDCLPDNDTNCNISVVRSPLNVSSTISITLNRNDNAAEFRCGAELDLGPEGPQPPPTMMSSPLNFTVYFKPVINTTKLPDTIPVFRGYPEELVCEADGHPPPEIKWLYSSDKDPHESGATLTVSEAGVYSCSAINEVDSISHEVKVIFKEDYLPLIAGFVAVTVVAVSLVFLFIYSIYYKNTRMRRYSLKNAKLDTHSSNVAHNGWDMQFPMTKLSYVFILCTGKPVHSVGCPVEMSPPSVLVRFGDPFSVNCSSPSDQRQSLGWEAMVGTGTGLKHGVSSITLKIDSVKNWNIKPICFINLLDGFQCMETLPVTVYKMPDSISISQPSQMGPMVEGEKYRMQCDIVNVAPLRNLSVHWHRGDKIIYTQTFDESSESPVNTSSVFDLTAQIGDNGTEMWCEAQLDFSPPVPNLSILSDSLKVIVLYSPTFTKPGNETLEISAGNETILDCTATGNPTPVYSWNFPHLIQKMKKNQNGNQLILTPPFGFPGTYNCTASNTQGSNTKYFTVIEATRNRTTFAVLVGVFVVLGAVLFIGGLLLLTPEGTFSFSKGGYLKGKPAWKPVHSVGCPVEMSPPSVLVRFGDPFSVNCSSPSDQRQSLGWEAMVGTEMPDSISISQPSQMGPMVEGEKYRMQCDIVNVAPLRNLSVHWHRGDKIIYTQTFDESSESPVNTSSVFDLTAQIGDNGTEMWCEAQLDFSPPVPNLSILSDSLKVIVLYSPTFTKPGNETLEISAGNETILDCTATGNPTPVYSWNFPHLIQKVKKNQNGNQLILTPPFGFPGTYNCTASNTQGSNTKYFTVIEATRNRTTFAVLCQVKVAPSSSSPPGSWWALGSRLSVRCEATRPVRVLGWESVISAAHTQQDLSVQWKVDSLIDWIEEPICYGVFFTAPRQCEEKLNLVLYKTPDSVSIRPVNHSGSMVEGKEYQLLCEVQNIAPVQYLTLRWYKGQTEVYNHSFSELTSSSPVQVSSILMVTPTKAENGAQYRCVAELELGPEGPQPPPTVTSEPLNASVYFPPTFLSPEPEVLDLIVGAEMTLNCSATGNPTPVYSWQSSNPIQEGMEDEAGLTSSSLLPGTYTCTASNTLEKKSKQFIVKAKTKGV
ncbi:hemicentin-2-like [Cottoperca gobio]|uniref:Hemicentin-2-like n=1 Tax=Cottoperca gobio TaxID=56716 RepID=A0A6J2Q552_COTGO|nr:hemicentin-2-like [Cottoperca gobio]